MRAAGQTFDRRTTSASWRRTRVPGAAVSCGPRSGRQRRRSPSWPIRLHSRSPRRHAARSSARRASRQRVLPPACRRPPAPPPWRSSAPLLAPPAALRPARPSHPVPFSSSIRLPPLARSRRRRPAPRSVPRFAAPLLHPARSHPLMNDHHPLCPSLRASPRQSTCLTMYGQSRKWGSRVRSSGDPHFLPGGAGDLAGSEGHNPDSLLRLPRRVGPSVGAESRR